MVNDLSSSTNLLVLFLYKNPKVRVHLYVFTAQATMLVQY